MTAVLWTVDLFVAAAIGSFLNVLIHRLPRGESIVYPPSHCPSCGTRLQWRDNIPVISFLTLKGRCRSCGEKIPFRYFAVECANILLWAAAFLLFGVSVEAVLVQLALSVLLAIFFSDFETGIIPDSLNAALAILGIAACFLMTDAPWWERLVGGIGGFALFWGIAIVFGALLKKEALGGGDVKLAGAGGLLLGYKLLSLGIFIASVLACLWLTIRKILRKPQADEFPFAPFLTAGFVLSLFFGYPMLDWYAGLFEI